jgi:hypothetical protein
VYRGSALPVPAAPVVQSGQDHPARNWWLVVLVLQHKERAVRVSLRKFLSKLIFER